MGFFYFRVFHVKYRVPLCCILHLCIAKVALSTNSYPGVVSSRQSRWPIPNLYSHHTSIRARFLDGGENEFIIVTWSLSL